MVCLYSAIKALIFSFLSSSCGSWQSALLLPISHPSAVLYRAWALPLPSAEQLPPCPLSPAAPAGLGDLPPCLPAGEWCFPCFPNGCWEALFSTRPCCWESRVCGPALRHNAKASVCLFALWFWKGCFSPLSSSAVVHRHMLLFGMLLIWYDWMISQRMKSGQTLGRSQICCTSLSHYTNVHCRFSLFSSER